MSNEQVIEALNQCGLDADPGLLSRIRTTDSCHREVEGLKDMSIEAYREAAAADAWLFGDYDAYESYDINTKKVSEEDESV